MKAKSPAYPYLAWMIIFIVAPLLIVAYFAFTDKTGAFTLANISQAGGEADIAALLSGIQNREE